MSRERITSPGGNYGAELLKEGKRDATIRMMNTAMCHGAKSGLMSKEIRGGIHCQLAWGKKSGYGRQVPPNRPGKQEGVRPVTRVSRAVNPIELRGAPLILPERPILGTEIRIIATYPHVSGKLFHAQQTPPWR